MRLIFFSVLVAATIVMVGAAPPFKEISEELSTVGGFLLKDEKKTVNGLNEIKFKFGSLAKLQELYHELDGFEGLIPTVHGMKPCNEKSEFCTLVYVYTYKVDLKVWWRVAEMVANFNKFLRLYLDFMDEKKVETLSPFEVNIDSFLYYPTFGKFAFAALPNVVESIEPKVNKNEFKKTMLKRLFDSIYKNKIPITKADRERIVELELKEYLVEKDITKVPENKKGIFDLGVKFVENADSFKYKNIKESDYLQVIRSQNQSNCLEVFLEKKKLKTVNYSTNDRGLTVVLCSQDKDGVLCALIESDYFVSSDRYTMFVDQGKRIMIDFVEGESTFEGKIMSFVEVYIIVTSDKNPEIIDSTLVQAGHYIKPEKGKSYFLCEAPEGDFKLFVNSEKPELLRTIKKGLGPLKVSKELKFSQVAPSQVKEVKKVCSEQYMRIYQFDIEESVVLAQSDGDKDKGAELGSYDIGEPVKDTFSEICAVPETNDVVLVEIQDKKLWYKSVEYEYQRKVVMKKLINSNESPSFCIGGEWESGYKLKFEHKTEGPKYFSLNFNAHEQAYNKDTNPFTYIYFSENKPQAIQFPAQKFILMKYIKANLLVSVSKVNDEFEVLVLYLKIDGNIQLVTSSGSAKLKVKSPPMHITKLVEYGFVKDTYKTEELINQEVYYLSETEVVYSIEIFNFNKCNPNLETVSGSPDIIKIYCSVLNNLKKPETYKKELLTTGMNRVIEQAAHIYPEYAETLLGTGLLI